MDLMEIKNEIINLSEVIAAAALKYQTPFKDEISLRQAKREFTAAWINYHDVRGNIKWTRRGQHENSPKVTSRLELLALREAEKKGVHMVRKAINRKA